MLEFLPYKFLTQSPKLILIFLAHSMCPQRLTPDLTAGQECAWMSYVGSKQNFSVKYIQGDFVRREREA
jgi:hypothetical protein